MVEGIVLQWPVDSRRVNQRFGENPDWYQKFGLPGHEGVDLQAPMEANVYAAAGGRVVQADSGMEHPYGLHVRLEHEVNGRLFQTIYAHLVEVFVVVGEVVALGQRIGLADSTGNSTGSHLHFGLKIRGEQTPGYPSEFVDPLPYMVADAVVAPPVPEPEPVPPVSDVVLYTKTQLNVRRQPTTAAEVVALLPVREPVRVLGDGAAARDKVGQVGAWIQVMTANGIVGFVAAQFVEERPLVVQPEEVVVYPMLTLRLRAGAGVETAVLGVVNEGEALVAMGDNVLEQVGSPEAWIQVQTAAGLVGFVVGSGVRLTGQIPPSAGFSVFALYFVNVRATASQEGHRLTVVMPGDALAVLGDESEARGKVGQAGQWLSVQAPTGHVGYVAANLVQTGGPPRSLLPMMGVVARQVVEMQAQPSFRSPVLGMVGVGESLTVVEEDLTAVAERVSQGMGWLHLQNQDGMRGWVRAAGLEMG